MIVLQLLLGLALLVAGAKGFIHGVEEASAILGISALLLSLLIIPIATELPEKVNSVLWIRKGKDTLAFGNITGAMVFQGTLLPAIGIMLTPWEPRQEVLLGIVMTLLAAVWLRYVIIKSGIRVWHLLVNGALYLTYIALVLIWPDFLAAHLAQDLLSWACLTEVSNLPCYPRSPNQYLWIDRV